MSPSVVLSKKINEDKKTTELIETILRWPEWKRRSICVDQSDIELLDMIRIISSSSSQLKSTIELTTEVVVVHKKTE